MSAPQNRIPPEHIDALRERTKLSDHVGKRVLLVERGGEYSGLCPFHTEKSPSFTVNDTKGFYHCFGCGAHGNIYDWLMGQVGMTFIDAVKFLEGETGLDDPVQAAKAREDLEKARQLRAEAEARKSEKDLQRALEIWKDGRSAAQSAVSLYLRGRGLELPAKSPIKCHPSLPYWHCRKGSKTPEIMGRYPAMLAAIQGTDGRFIGLHQTYLSLDNGGKVKIPDPDDPGCFLKPKKMKGSVMGGAIRLTAPAPFMAVAEGIENALTVLKAKPDWAVWVAGSLGNICGRGEDKGPPHPAKVNKFLPSEEPDMKSTAIWLPDMVEEVLIVADNDSKDPLEGGAYIKRACNRFEKQGKKVRVAWPEHGKDLNDMLVGA